MPKGYPKTAEGRRKQQENLSKGHFPKGVSGNPSGRPPKTMTLFIREMEEAGYEIPSNETIIASFLYMCTLPEDRLKEILADKERPMMQRIVSKGVLDKKGLDVLERIIDRAYGRRHIDITTNGKDIKQDPVIVHLVSNSEEFQSIKRQVEEEKERKYAERERVL